MKTYKCKIEEQVVTAIERLSYEYYTLQDNVAFLIDKHKDDPEFLSSEIFKKYQDDEINAKEKFEIAKSELEKALVPDTLKNHKISWNLDFPTRVFTITQQCDCEVELCEEEEKIFTII